MFLVGFLLTAAAVAAPSDWSQITPNMPASQVRQFLGQPQSIKTVAAGEVWYYFPDIETGFIRLKNHRTLGLIVLDATPPTAEQLAASAPKPAPLPTPPQQLPQPKPQPPVPPPAVVAPIPQPLPAAPPPAAVETAPRAKSDPGSRYFIGCGIAFIALAAAFGIAQAVKALR